MGKAVVSVEKRVRDDRLFDMDLSDLLDDGERALSATAEAGEGSEDYGLVFGPVAVNAAPVPYPHLGRVAQPGKSLQVRISRGRLPDGLREAPVVVRFLVATNVNPRIEATGNLRLTDPSS